MEKSSYTRAGTHLTRKLKVIYPGNSAGYLGEKLELRNHQGIHNKAHRHFDENH